MATRWALWSTSLLLVILVLAAGCIFWGGDAPPSTPTPSATPSPPPEISTTVRDSGSPAGGGEDPAGTAVGTASPTTTATRSPTPTPAPASSDGVTGSPVPLTPSPAPTGTHTIAELAAADPELSRFTSALRQGGIYEELNGTGPYTVFAPNNAAFAAIPPSTLGRLLLDPSALAAIANFHVVEGPFFRADLAGLSMVTTRSGLGLPVSELGDGTLQVDGARVIRADIVATNGVLHVIDDVMIPPGVL